MDIIKVQLMLLVYVGMKQKSEESKECNINYYWFASFLYGK